ncbi:hypothetical protein L6164_001052 [Bauhinia variegata]|uniref:Uncharacterized protein n=1 Tax=Bauhinia variegata TaxID=167791 RepID=A0ACB9Q8K4_BAUVA|nr:hypothetical protein L6164_001052 [Bauhinia variegata]
MGEDKRHLPPWMLQKVAASHVSKSEIVENTCYTEEGALNQVPDLKANAENDPTKKTGPDHRRKTTGKKSCSLIKCEAKRRSLGQQDGSSDNITREEKRKNGSSRGIVRKSSIKKGLHVEDPSYRNGDKDPVQAFSNDDVELTVDDLMAIAEEYVKISMRKEQQEVPGRQCESVKQVPATSESRSTNDLNIENERSPAHAKPAVDHYTPTTASEIIPTSTCQTGDPAQDMLDLFLGPLLKKKPLEEEKRESFVEDFSFTHELARQGQDEIVGEEKGPLMKKKSSLKDKVETLLELGM